MRLNLARVVGLALLLAVCCCCSWLCTAQGSGDQNNSLESNKPRLFRLVDFEKFKLVFEKKYKSFVEELSRMRIFLAKCFQSFVSTLNFLHGRASSYKSINYMSDWTLDEWRATLMKPQVYKRPHEQDDELDEATREVDEESIRRAADIEASGIQDELDVQTKMIEVAKKELGGEEKDRSLLEIANVQAKRRRKRDLAEVRPQYEVADLMGGVLSKIDRLEQPEQSGASEPRLIGAPDEDGSFLLGGGNLPSLNKETRSPPNRSLARSELFVDHRGCFVEPKFQSRCGSCFAFAAISVLEYHYCRSTGKQVRFSEQFPMDCGSRACTGGFAWQVIEFSEDNGVEREEAYPYFSRRKKCFFGKPIEDPSKSGFWKIGGLEKRRLDLSEFEDEIVNGPILVDLAVSNDFADYGGGVDQLDCPDEDDVHTMVLVGHGRENGLDFWLLRNSYSVTWGEEGYYKVSKNSFKKCFVDHPDASWIIEGGLTFKRNPSYDSRLMEKLTSRWKELLKSKNESKTQSKPSAG